MRACGTVTSKNMYQRSSPRMRNGSATKNAGRPLMSDAVSTGCTAAAGSRGKNSGSIAVQSGTTTASPARARGAAMSNASSAASAGNARSQAVVRRAAGARTRSTPAPPEGGSSERRGRGRAPTDDGESDARRAWTWSEAVSTAWLRGRLDADACCRGCGGQQAEAEVDVVLGTERGRGVEMHHSQRRGDRAGHGFALDTPRQRAGDVGALELVATGFVAAIGGERRSVAVDAARGHEHAGERRLVEIAPAVAVGVAEHDPAHLEVARWVLRCVAEISAQPRAGRDRRHEHDGAPRGAIVVVDRAAANLPRRVAIGQPQHVVTQGIGAGRELVVVVQERNVAVKLCHDVIVIVVADAARFDLDAGQTGLAVVAVPVAIEIRPRKAFDHDAVVA